MDVSLKSLIGRRLKCSDGYACKIADIHLHSGNWQVRQVAITVPAHPWRQLLIGTDVFRSSVWARQYIGLKQGREAVENAVRIDENPPVDWRIARDELNFLMVATHWSPGSAFPEGIAPASYKPGVDLYSLKHLSRYAAHAKDDQAVGRIVDFSMDAESWRISSVVVCVRADGVAKCVELDVARIASVNYERRVLALDISRESILAERPVAPYSSSGARAAISGLHMRLVQRFSHNARHMARMSHLDSGGINYPVRRLVAMETFPIPFENLPSGASMPGGGAHLGVRMM